MQSPVVTLHPATFSDFDYVYGLCESTMRVYVETDLGDCFEKIARTTITALLAKGLFSTLQANGERVGAIAFEQGDAHIQLEELYVDRPLQNSQPPAAFASASPVIPYSAHRSQIGC